MDEKIYLLNKAYDLLERVTPLTYDCGKMCDGLCCQGDGQTGMHLFPGEEEIIRNVDGFSILNCEGNHGYKMVVCNGTCDRKYRPLACRIYPCFPMITEDGFDVRTDIRGIGSCPILRENIRIDYSFIRQVRKVARLFSGNEELKKYILNVNSTLDEIENFVKRMI